MPQTLYIHIGHYKTGTTALQRFLLQNTKQLKRHGVIYLPDPMYQAKHSKFAFALYHKAGVSELMHGYANKTPPEEIWQDLFRKVRKARSDILISSEEFIRLGAHPGAAEILENIIREMRGKIRFRIIAYLRPPQSHLRSWFNQLIKMNKTPVPDFNTAVCEIMEPVHYDYDLALRPWIEIFGQEALILRPYTGALKEENRLFEDFLSTLGIFGTKQFEFPAMEANPRLDDRLTEFTRFMQLGAYPERDMSWIQGQVLRDHERYPRQDGLRGQGFDQVTARAEAGLDMLRQLPGNAVDVEQFKTALPRPHDLTQAELSELLAWLFKDVQRMRTNLHQRQGQLAARLAEVEKHLGLSKPDAPGENGSADS